MPFILPDPVDVARNILLEAMERDRQRAVRAARFARYRDDKHVVAEVLRAARDEEDARR